MKARATIIVAGDVQEVGFRAFVMRLGQKMKLTGNVENLFDGTVRILCEGERETVESYIKKLKANDGTVNIENVDVKFSKPQNKFKGFRVKIDDQGSEMFQGFATAGRLLTELKGEVRNGNVELKNTIVKGNAELGNKIDTLGDRIDNNFNKTEQKFHVISENMIVIMEKLEKSTQTMTTVIEELKQSRHESAKATENLTKVVQTFIEMQKKQ